MPRSLNITLPWLPPKELSPNSRVHWSVKYKAAQEMKDDVLALILEQGWRGPCFQHALVDVQFGMPDKRRRDIDNLLASMKPGLDA